MSKLALQALTGALASKMVQIEDVIASYGLKLPELTLIARDPGKPDMVISLSSEPEQDITLAFLQARRATTKDVVKHKLEDMDEEDLRAVMTGLAKFVELGAETFYIEKPLFIMMLFNNPRVAQYIGNCERADMIKAMRELADRMERRETLERE